MHAVSNAPGTDSSSPVFPASGQEDNNPTIDRVSSLGKGIGCEPRV